MPSRTCGPLPPNQLPIVSDRRVRNAVALKTPPFEQQVRWPDGLAVGALLAQERGEVAGDGGIRLERQPDLAEPAGPLSDRLVG